jgi:DNA-binding MarR family transcriptional regulator
MSDVPWLDTDEERVWRSLVLLWRLGFLQLERTFRQHGLIHLEYGVLAVLAESDEGQLTAGQLAALTGLSTSHLSHRLKNLETKDLIERAPDAEDRRIVNITITDAGRRLVAEVAPAHVADVRRLVFDHLDRSEVEVLAESLGRLADHLGSFPPRRTPS